MARRKRRQKLIGRIGGHIKLAIDRHRRAWRRRRAFKAWRALHPDGSYALFCAEETQDYLKRGGPHPTLGVSNVDEATVTRRAQRILADFKAAGGTPRHVVVDYGRGSLWVGEAFIEYLEPGNYIGLDVVDFFYKDGLARLPAELVASRKPVLRVIDDASLAEVRSRRPDFIYSMAVMQHVPPGDLAGYFSRIISLAGPDTRIDIGTRAVRFPWGRQPNLYWHTPSAVRRALAPLGYVADYSAERRIERAVRGFSLVRR